MHWMTQAWPGARHPPRAVLSGPLSAMAVGRVAAPPMIEACFASPQAMKLGGPRALRGEGSHPGLSRRVKKKAIAAKHP